LTNVTLRYALALADKGWQKAMDEDSNLALGLNVHQGKIYYRAVAEAHDLESVSR
jgi:alanine dehydrogenase